ncbi:addiction module protein [Sphaerospermopsis aphanizomenoides]|nr:addiction module protein [Sphaerospermopsis aphanizomenoides]
MMKADFAPIFELGLSEKLQLLEDLWDDIATQSANVPVLDWQKDELDQRKVLHLQDPSLASSWESVKARIRSNIRC